MVARVEELSTIVKEAVIRKNRVTALATLRSKKLTEISLEQRYAMLNQLEEVAAKIVQASDNVELVKVMESSALVLHGLNKKVGGVDRVDQVFDNLREQMGEVDEVGNIIANAVTESATIDSAEIDEELAMLERHEKEREQEAERARQEAAAEREAAKTAEQLMRIPELSMSDERFKSPTPTKETAERIGRLSLEEKVEPPVAS
jgi:charged multivesicular body protein 7